MDEMYIADAEGYSNIAPTGDGRDRSGISDEKARMVDADKMSNMWARYVNWKKFWFPNESPFMEDFARYMRNFHQYDIGCGS